MQQMCFCLERRTKVGSVLAGYKGIAYALWMLILMTPGRGRNFPEVEIEQWVPGEAGRWWC